MIKTFDYENTPVVDIVNEMIIDAETKGASDIHFDPTATVLKVRIRIDGTLIEYAEVPESVKKNLITRIKIIAGMNITESRLPQDGAIKRQINNKDLDLRVSSLPITFGEKVVIRILDYSMSLQGLENLGFSPFNLKKVMNLLKLPHGIILITGATGTGKSTTVYAMLQKLNKISTNIITVEDPVEMKIAGINQVQVMSEIGLTFNNSLRSILRQDPDIIMIGEIRDDDTARIAVRSSITGHLVLSTIHTNNSLNTIERLLDMEVERYLLGSALEGIISQRLTKKLCPHCRKLKAANEYEKRVFKKVLNQNIENIYEPVGCEQCFNGYHGRIAIHEVLEITQEIRDAIINNTRKDALRSLVYSGTNLMTLLQDGLLKVIGGETSFDEIIRIIDLKDDFGDKDDEIKDALIGKEETNTEEIINEPTTTEPVKEKTLEEPKEIEEEVTEETSPIEPVKKENIQEEPKGLADAINNVEDTEEKSVMDILDNYVNKETTNNTQEEKDQKTLLEEKLQNKNYDTFNF